MNVNSYSNQTSYNLSRRHEAIKYIVVHYTATNASAKNNCQYFSTGNRGASADYFIDDTGIWRFNPDVRSYYSWAVGDGKGRYGITNSNSVSIEVVNAGGAFTSKEVSHLRDLVTHLMKELAVPSSRVVRHYDASRKACPAYYVDGSRWSKLKSEITTEKKTESNTNDTTDRTVFDMAECIFYLEDEHTFPNGKKFPKYSRVYWTQDGGCRFCGAEPGGPAKTDYTIKLLQKLKVPVIHSNYVKENWIGEAYKLTEPGARGTFGNTTLQWNKK